MHEPSGPRFVRYFGPVLQSLLDLGGSGRPAEVADRVTAALKLTDAELSETLDNGASRFRNQVAWARFYLVKAGHVDSSRRGVRSLTDKGRAAVPMSHAQALAIFDTVREQFAASPKTADDKKEAPEATPHESDAVPTSYRAQLAQHLHALTPGAFERFAQRLLREAGFQQVTVTGKSGDGGIDGIGMLQVNALVSFKILFQCKRYSGSVTPSHARDFRGSMTGRADKGIIISTAPSRLMLERKPRGMARRPSSSSMARDFSTCAKNSNSA
ncbi:MAG: winged helix-turn-helix domain-containing protein [Gemmatimonadales bacterium]